MSGAINSVVRDVLSRDARPDEVSYFQAELNAGETLSDVRREVAGGSEAAGDISWLFANVVGRQAGAGDLAYWTGRLGSDVSLATIRQAFAYTGEAASAIDGVYQRGLSRGATGGELGVYQNYLAYGGSLDGVRYGVFHSAEEDYAVDNIYRSILDRPARMDEIRVFEENALGQGGTLADVRQIVAHSAEAAGDIAGLFRNELGREAGAGDLGYWTGRLQDGVGLVTIRHAFAYTGEAAGWIQDAYQRGLGRSADAGEQGTWQDYLANGGSIEGMRYGVFHSTSEFNVLDGLYREMLGHGIRPDEAAVFENDALGRGATLAGIRNIIAYSPEAAQDVDSSYRQVTGRGATSPEVASFQFALTVGGVWTHAGVRWAIGHSDAAAAAVDGVAQSVLGHAIDPALKAAYEDQMGGAGRRSLDDVRWDLAHRPEAAAVVTGLYRELLGRDPQVGAGEVAWAEDSLGRGVTLADLKLVVAHSSEAQKDFDAAYYLAQNPDVAQSGMDPYVHYVTRGWKEGRNPSALFDTTYYLDMNPDVAAAGVNPLLHYRTTGWREGRDPSVQFSTRAYLAANPDVAAAGIDPLAHYVASGRSEGRTAFHAPLDPKRSAGIQAIYVEVLGRLATNAELYDRQVQMMNGQSLAGLRMAVASGREAADDIQAIFSAVAGHGADGAELAAWQKALGGTDGWTIDLVGPSIARTEIDRFYQQLFGRDASSDEYAAMLNAVEAGQSLKGQFDSLRPLFAASEYETALIDIFYKKTFDIDAPLVASSGALANIEAALAAGQSLLAIEDSLTPLLTKQIQGLYGNYLGRSANGGELSYWTGQANAGMSLDTMRAQIATSPEAAAHIGTLIQQNFNRAAQAVEVSAWQAGEAVPGVAGLSYTVTTGSGTVLATVDARTLVVEAAVYIGLSGGTAPTLTGPDGQVIRFQNGYAFAAFAMGLAMRSGQMTDALMQIYGLTVSWMNQVGQAEIEAAVRLQVLAQSDIAAGRTQDAYLHYLGAQLATKMQEMSPDQRQAVSASVAIGQYVATITITGDVNDAGGLAGFSYSLSDTDPGRTALIVLAQAAAQRGVADAGNELLAFLDNAQARVDVAYANLPANARTDRMLSVAQRFVDAAYQAAQAGNWNLVQTLETAADVSLQIAAMPEGSRHALTERFRHKKTTHDITVDPNAADPFASFTDHSKGEDVIGAIVEAVVGVIINILAIIPITAPVFAPLAVAWDVAQAGKNFAQGNILGGFLSLGAAAGVGLAGLDIAAQGAAQGSFYAEAASFTNGFAGSLGFTGVQAVAATGTTAAIAEVTATAQLGQTILSGAALIGGASGIAQSAGRGDWLGIAAGALQVAAGVAGGLISTRVIDGNLARTITAGFGLTAAGTSAADAFKNGDLAGGLATSLNLLLPLVAQTVLGRASYLRTQTLRAVDQMPEVEGDLPAYRIAEADSSTKTDGSYGPLERPTPVWLPPETDPSSIPTDYIALSDEYGRVLGFVPREFATAQALTMVAGVFVPLSVAIAAVRMSAAEIAAGSTASVADPVAAAAGTIVLRQAATLLPGSLTPSQFGALAGFAQGLEASALASTIPTAEAIAALRAAGVTREMLVRYQDGYTLISRGLSALANASAVHRSTLIANILKMY